MINTNKYDREFIMRWWNKLYPIQKQTLFDNYVKDNFTSAINLSQLTGREIEIIYKKKFNPLGIDKLFH